MAKAGTFHDAFIDELRDTYSAEKQISKALPKMVKKASSPELRDAFNTHLQETLNQVQRLERVFEVLREKAKGKPCEGMAGILEEGQDVMGEKYDSDTMDACLIASAQRVEHYEIAAYGTLVSWAKTMGHTQAAQLLQETLSEEEATDKKLSQLAEQTINQQAAGRSMGTMPKADTDEDERETDDSGDGRGARSERGSAKKSSKKKSSRR